MSIGELNPHLRLLLGPGPSPVHPRVLKAMSTNVVGHLDPDFLDSRVQDLLKIGDAYQKAYAASFTYPMADKLAALDVPCLLIDWPGAASYDRLAMAKAVAPNCSVADMPEDLSAIPSLLDPFFKT